MSRTGPFVLAALLVAAGANVSFGVAPLSLRVRASGPFAACLVSELEEFTRETGIGVTIEVRQPEPVVGADVVVGDDSELTRALESGTVDLATATDIGTIPWVFVSPSGSGDLHAAAARADRVVVLAGRLARKARAAFGSGIAIHPTPDSSELRAAPYALVPRSLAGAGQRRTVDVPPLLGVAAVVTDSAQVFAARRLVAFLGSASARSAGGGCLSPVASLPDVGTRGAASYAKTVVDWWLPLCSIERDAYNDPQQVLGAPDAVWLGVKDQYLGMMSMGMGGYVTVEMGSPAVDGPGPDVRVYQTESSEPVTIYASNVVQGPFTLLGLQVSCGTRTGSGIYSHHCDFDLHDAGLTEARYFKVEDGEIFPCLKAGTTSEGADIDAIEVLNPKQ